MMGIINSHHLYSSPGSFFSQIMYRNAWGTPGGPLGTSWCNGNPFHFQWVPIIFDFIYWVTTQEQGLWGTHVLGDPCIGRDTRHPFPFPTGFQKPKRKPSDPGNPREKQDFPTKAGFISYYGLLVPISIGFASETGAVNSCYVSLFSEDCISSEH